MATIKVNGVELYYERRGTGEPVVLVHGGYGDADGWELLVGEIAGVHDVVTYDQRGHTRSERPPGEPTMHDFVADLAALIEQLRIAPAHVVGNSMGGAVVLRLAARSPEVIRTLTVHEPALFTLLARDPATKPYADAHADVRRLMARTLETDPIGAVDGFIEWIAPGASGFVPDDRKKQMADNASYHLRGPGLELDVDLEALSSFTSPTLLTEGDGTPEGLGLHHVVRILDRVLPASRLVTIEGAGHSPAFTHAAQYGALLRDFWKAN